jgi:hypothetical protein
MSARRWVFDVINLGVQDGAKVLSAIDNLAVAGCAGFCDLCAGCQDGPAI